MWGPTRTWSQLLMTLNCGDEIYLQIFSPEGGPTVPDHDLSVSCGYLPPGSHQSVLEGNGQRSLTVEILLAQGHASLALY